MSTATKAKKKSGDGIKLQPLGDRVVVEREESESKTAGGIVLPDSAKDKPSRGTVIAVGDGRLLDDGTRGKLQVKIGDKVLFTSLRPRSDQAQRRRAAADARRRHPGGHRVSITLRQFHPIHTTGLRLRAAGSEGDTDPWPR